MGMFGRAPAPCKKGGAGEVELVFLAPPSRRQNCCSTFSHTTVWNRSTFRVFDRAPAEAANEAGAGALPKPYMLQAMFPKILI